MIRDLKDIRDDQIRVIGEEEKKTPPPHNLWLIAFSILGVVIIGVITFIILQHNTSQESKEVEPACFEPVAEVQSPHLQPIGRDVAPEVSGFTEICDTVINDIPIKIYIPHNAEMSLHIGKVDKNDSTIIYTAQAADVRADNGGIVGAFVLKGEPRAWGLSKKGFCASIDGKVTIGVAENSPLFEEATEKGGYFFRQYPLVSNGQLIDNEPKGKSIRRGICERQGEIFMVETSTTESFHDFAQALADLGVNEAIYLVGSSAYGWAVDEYGERHEFGDDNYYTGRRRMPKNTSYIVWRKK